uniref:Phosphatidylinositol-4-phosphate 5-kinase like 1 n=1 Tax=Latimeria chalumnae TaxID=7897 RepID=H3BAD1_LATCH
MQVETQEAMMGGRSRTVKHKWLWKLRQQWKLLGLFEIDQEHEFYEFTCMLKEGLTAAVQDSMDTLEKNSLSEADYTAKLTQTHKGFEMRTYAAPVFTHFRQIVGVSEKEYQLSLSSKGFYLQFISNSKSKANFFLTNDKRFFLKTQSKREIRFLLSNLKVYIQHLEKYPHSLLVKFLGVHRIQIPRQGTKYFIVMQSVFYPDERINTRYDIKGCEVSRWTDPAPEGSQVIVVLKDLNFEGNSISLDQQRSWFMHQVQIDTQFLQGLHVLDYSLLVALQPLHADERGQRWSFANIILRTKKSINPGGSPTFSTRTTVPEIAVQNRRLLPNYKNPLHVIDGPEMRYFVGIIDIFTVYGFRKKLEYLWKSLRYRGRAFSTVNPAKYASRLCQWVQDHTV